MKNSVEKLKELVKGTVLEKEPMRKHTSFNIGGPAEIFVIPNGNQDIINIIKWSQFNKLPLTVIGNGTNILVSDRGISGVVIKLVEKNKRPVINNKEVKINAGAFLSSLLLDTQKQNLGGIEFLYGIPGTVGGAVYMNAGSNSHFISKYVKSAEVLDEKGNPAVLKHKDMKFDYRYSLFHEANFIILNVLFEFEESDPVKILNEIELCKNKKASHNGIEYPNVGSIFKNPPTTYAGKIIDDAMCKNMRCGGAAVSDIHANFIVNVQNATSQDVINLMKNIVKTVYDQFNIKLIPEIKLVGDFSIEERDI